MSRTKQDSPRRHQEVFPGLLLSVVLIIGVQGKGTTETTVFTSAYPTDDPSESTEGLTELPDTTTEFPVLWPPYSESADGYIIYSDKCKIPELPILTQEIQPFLKNISRLPCFPMPPLTRIIRHKSTGKRILYIDRIMEPKYFTCPTDCCYSEIKKMSGLHAEETFALTRCKHFEKATVIDPKIEFLYVKCNKQSNRKLVYSNVHFLLPERKRLRKNLDRVKSDEKQKRISVLVLGIDSISRINFYRTMPQTAKYVNEMGWFELYGYNKVGINTFPNVLAMLAGISMEYKGDNRTIKPDDPETKCDPNDFFDSCPFIWKQFQKAGYVTAYGEDKPEYSTFNYEKKGFQHSPTDYYLRLFLVAAKSLLKVRHPNIAMHCVGFMNEAELVYDYGLEFIEHHRDDPYFGIFWVNSFSHNYFHTPQAMDTKILDYLQQFGQKGVFNKSIVLFLSDHGIRFGPYRRSNQAYIEERLPFFFIWLPPWLKAQHPELEDALTINKHRLATPLDVHQTLKHIMILSGQGEHLDSATVEDEGSQTLFKPLPPNRSCRDAQIPDFYCACRDLIVSVEVPTEDLEAFVQLIQKSEKIQVEAVMKVNQITLGSETDDEGAELYILTVKDKKFDYEAAIRKEYATNRTVLEYFYLISCLTCKPE